MITLLRAFFLESPNGLSGPIQSQEPSSGIYAKYKSGLDDEIALQIKLQKPTFIPYLSLSPKIKPLCQNT
jgi:hypothetical protein